MGRRNTLLYIATIALSAIGFGAAIDYLLPSAWFTPKMASAHACCVESTDWVGIACSAILCALLLYALVIKKYYHKHNRQQKMAKEYRINGMMCVHCKSRVEKGLSEVEGVTLVTVDLNKKVAMVEGTVADEAIIAKISDLGYEYVG
jgi:copper chaperone CopZ